MKKTGYRILSFAGNAGMELTSTLLLKGLEERMPGFMNREKLVLAGTSAGGMQSLLLATQDDPASVLGELEALWLDFPDLVRGKYLGYVPAFLGLRPFFSYHRLKKRFEDANWLGNKRLKDLTKKVVITAFQMRGHPRPKIFHNFGPIGDADLKEKAADVALRTGATPILIRITDGLIDGGVVANNPAMVALAQVLNEKRDPIKQKEMKLNDELVATVDECLADVKLLSIGLGRDMNCINIGSGEWGYFKWLFNPFNPLLVIQSLLEGDNLGVHYQAERIMSWPNYHYLNPRYISTGNPFLKNPFFRDPKDIKKMINRSDTQVLLDKTAQWIDDTKW